jgi:hypothetical protein
MDEIKRYRLLIGGAVLLGMIGLTWWAVNDNTGDTPAADVTTPELPEIDRAAITALEIHRPGEEPAVRLVKDGDAWRVAEPVDAPASTTAVDTALDKLADLEIRGVATSRENQHERLEVDAEHGVHVTARAGDAPVIDLWIGAFTDGNTMIRLEGQNDVLMARGSIKFAFNKPPRDWRDRAIIDLASDELREVTFTNTNGTFHFTKSGDAWSQVTEAAEGQEPPPTIERFDATKVRTAVSSLARLRASDFAAEDVTAESAGLGASAAHVTFVSGEGDDAETTTLLVGNEVEDGNRYVQRQGDDTIFVVSRFMADRLVPSVATFQQSEEPEEGAAPAPSAMPGAPGGGQIPPEVMRQIQQQLQQQGAAGGH